MISAWWMIPVFIVGAICGLIVTCLAVAAKNN